MLCVHVPSVVSRGPGSWDTGPWGPCQLNVGHAPSRSRRCARENLASTAAHRKIPPPRVGAVPAIVHSNEDGLGEETQCLPFFRVSLSKP